MSQNTEKPIDCRQEGESDDNYQWIFTYDKQGKVAGRRRMYVGTHTSVVIRPTCAPPRMESEHLEMAPQEQPYCQTTPVTTGNGNVSYGASHNGEPGHSSSGQSYDGNQYSPPVEEGSYNLPMNQPTQQETRNELQYLRKDATFQERLDS
jgi:hypothetical protein